MDLRSGILASARALGVKPVDLATAISYETAGTFDPMKRGPTTQWGQHQGLIQFGQPQAKRYGVDWSDPIGSQLGEDGAVVRYLRDTGVRPGMGLLDIYSAINAGGVGRYNRTDANNGGAPGTVADKVNNQMAGHRKKAMALLGEDEQIAADAMAAIGRGPVLSTSGGSETAIGSEGNDTMTPFQPEPEERGLLFNMLGPKARGWATPERVARLQMALEGATLNPNMGVMKAAEATIQNSAEQKKANRTAEWLAQNGRDDLAQAVASGAIDARAAVAEAMKKPDPTADLKVINGQLVNVRTGEVQGDYRDPEKPATSDDIREYEYARRNNGYEGSFQDWMLDQRKAGASQTTINNGSEVGTIPQGYELFTDPETGARRLRAIPGGPEDTSKSDEAAASNRDTATGIVTNAAARAREAAKSRNFGSVGTSLVGAINPMSDSAEVMRQVEVLQSNAKIENLQAMRAASPTGGALGAVSDKESQMLAAKSGALDPNSPNFLRDLDDYERTLLQIVHGFEAGNRLFEASRKQTTTEAAPKRLKYNPDTGTLE